MAMIAADYLRENYEPGDRIAVVLINRERHETVQRIVDAEKAATDKYQGWLRHMNATGYDVYASVNALKPEAAGRKKEDIAAVRHVYLDIDADGRQVVDRLLARTDVPRPNYVLESSPGKFQTIWRAREFTADRAEELVRGLARDAGGDPAVWDSARVLRVPGFRNHKYPEIRHYVSVERTGTGYVAPQDFPGRLFDRERTFATALEYERATGRETAKERHPVTGDQSARDFGYAMRRLERGDSPAEVAAAIAEYRRARGDKTDPERYAYRYTVPAAQRKLEQIRAASGGRDRGR